MKISFHVIRIVPGGFVLQGFPVVVVVVVEVRGRVVEVGVVVEIVVAQCKVTVNGCPSGSG